MTSRIVLKKFGSIIVDSFTQVIVLELPLSILFNEGNYISAITQGLTPSFNLIEGHASPLNHLASAITRKSIKSIAEDYFNITPETYPWVYKGIAITAGLLGGGLKYSLNKGFKLETFLAGGINAALYELASNKNPLSAVAIEAADGYIQFQFGLQKGLLSTHVFEGALIGVLLTSLSELCYDEVKDIVNNIGLFTYSIATNTSSYIFNEASSPDQAQELALTDNSSNLNDL